MHVALNIRSTSEKGAVTVWTAVAVLAVALLVVVIAAGGLYVYRSSERIKLANAKLEQEARQARAELQRKEAEDQAKVTLAQTQRDQVLAPTRSATNLLAGLLTGINEAQNEAEALKTSDAGKAIARHQDLTELARRVYETELKALPTQGEVTLRLEGARRLEQQLVAASGTAYTPEADMEKSAQDLITWGTEGQVKLARVRQSLAALVQESKAKVTVGSITEASPTLEAAMTSLSQRATATSLKVQESAAAEARAQAEITNALAEAKRIQTEAEIRAQAILADATAKKEQADREIQQREAQMKVEQANTQVAVQQQEDEATKILLRQKASDPKVLAELAPFTTPGYWTLRGLAADKKPLSFGALQASGALADDMRGLQKLVDVATSGYDRARPRWDMNRRLWVRKPELIEKVKSAQKYLNELGPVLVEKGLLEP